MNKTFGIQKKLLLVVSLFALTGLAGSCNNPSSGQPERPASAPAANKADPAREAEQIVAEIEIEDAGGDDPIGALRRVDEPMLRVPCPGLREHFRCHIVACVRARPVPAEVAEATAVIEQAADAVETTQQDLEASYLA